MRIESYDFTESSGGQAAKISARVTHAGKTYSLIIPFSASEEIKEGQALVKLQKTVNKIALLVKDIDLKPNQKAIIKRESITVTSGSKIKATMTDEKLTKTTKEIFDELAAPSPSRKSIDHNVINGFLKRPLDDKRPLDESLEEGFQCLHYAKEQNDWKEIYLIEAKLAKHLAKAEKEISGFSTSRVLTAFKGKERQEYENKLRSASEIARTSFNAIQKKLNNDVFKYLSEDAENSKPAYKAVFIKIMLEKGLEMYLKEEFDEASAVQEKLNELIKEGKVLLANENQGTKDFTTLRDLIGEIERAFIENPLEEES